MARILVADDYDAIRAILKRALRGEVHTVSVAANGIDALEQIRMEQPEVIILDLMMPKMSGWEVYSQLSEEQRRTTAVIILSAAAQLPLARQAMADATFMTKPFDLDQLFGVIEQLLRETPSTGTPCGQAA